jgi:hypothetical protein
LKPVKSVFLNAKQSARNSICVWTVGFETPVCKLYLLFISANAAQEKEKKEESAAAHWCFKVCSHALQPTVPPTGNKNCVKLHALLVLQPYQYINKHFLL